MGDQTKLGRRLGAIAGTVCVVASLALLSPGVQVVRADDELLMSVDPGLAAAAKPAADPAPAPMASTITPPAYPIVPASDVATARRPGVSGIEVQPGIVVLNTRGFNYGPPPTPLAPEALAQEAAPR